MEELGGVFSEKSERRSSQSNERRAAIDARVSRLGSDRVIFPHFPLACDHACTQRRRELSSQKMRSASLRRLEAAPALVHVVGEFL